MTDKNSDQVVEQLKGMLNQVVKQAEDLRDNGATALGQTAGAAAAGVASAQKRALQDLKELQDAQANIRDGDDSGWQGFKNDFHNFFAQSRVKHEEHQMERDIEKAQKKAEKADNNAANALQHAAEALKAAEVAVLDDVQAWAYAEELEADLSA